MPRAMCTPGCTFHAVGGMRTRHRWSLLLVAAFAVLSAAISSAEPSTFPAIPVCGDLDGSETPLVLHCPDLTRIPDVHVLRVPGEGIRTIGFDFVYQPAMYGGEVGMFAVDDASGTINGLVPGAAGYLGTALDRARVIFPKGSTAWSPDVAFPLAGGTYVAFFVVQQDTLANLRVQNPTNDLALLPVAFFSIDSLNPDGVDHFVAFENPRDGYTQIGLEDKTGGESDFADVVLDITPSLVARFNTPPTLSWTGEPGYEAGGVAPDSGTIRTTFAYRVTYKDADGDLVAGGAPVLHITRAGGELAGSPFPMAATDPADTDATDGIAFALSTMLSPPSLDYAYRFEASDGADNATGPPTFPTDGPDVRNTPPVASFLLTPGIGNAATTFTADPTGSWDLEDPPEDLRTRWDWEDDGTWDTAWGLLVPALHVFGAPGTRTVRLAVRDTGGLSDQMTRQTLVDGLAPTTVATLRGIHGSDGWFVSDVEVLLEATDDLSGVDQTMCRMDGEDWAPYLAPLTIHQDGIHTVGFYSRDLVGNEEMPQAVEVRVDTAAPITWITLDGVSGTNGWYVSAVAVTLAAMDATSGLAAIRYRVDGGAWRFYDTAFTIPDDGTHVVDWFAEDRAGIREGVASSLVRVDATPPVFLSTSPSGIVDRFAVAIEWTAEDATSGIDSFAVRLPGRSAEPMRMQTRADIVLPVGDHVVTVFAVDRAGNVATSDVRFRIVAPQVSRPVVLPDLLFYAALAAIPAILFVVALWLERRHARREARASGAALLSRLDAESGRRPPASRG